MINRPTYLLAWLAALVVYACACGADAERDLGIVANRADMAAQNSERFNAARCSIDFGPGEFYFTVPLRYGLPVGGRIEGAGAPGYELPEGYFSSNDYRGPVTQFIAVGATGNEDFLDEPGVGWQVSGIQFVGARWLTAADRPQKPWVKSCIAVEGHNQPPSGRGTIRDCMFDYAECGIRALGTPEETHADLCLVENCAAFNVTSFFRSENNQAVGWTFRHVTVNEVGNSLFTIFDLKRGGRFSAYGVRANGNHVTLTSVGEDMSPNDNHAGIYDFQWDHPGDAQDAFFCPLDTQTKTFTGVVTGIATNPPDKASSRFAFDYRRAGLDRNKGFTLNVTNLPR
jgi:hypothetical protein